MGRLRTSLLFAALAGVLAALPAAASTASAVERVAVAGPGVTSAFPKGVEIELKAPPEYVSGSANGDSGRWLGPEYWASGDSKLAGRTAIGWKVSFVHSYETPRRVARAALELHLPVILTDPIAVRHIVGGRVVGTIAGFIILTRGKAPLDASYEGAIAFPVGHLAYTRVRFVLDQPASDSAGSAGHYLVKGEISPSAWEDGQAFWAFTGTRLVGKLPPKKVLVGVRAHVLYGRVHDYFTHPVPGARVTLERHGRSGWAPVASAQATRFGSFSLTAAARGAYRVRAQADGEAAKSRTVRLAK